jgi:hypothetical protein
VVPCIVQVRLVVGLACHESESVHQSFERTGHLQSRSETECDRIFTGTVGPCSSVPPTMAPHQEKAVRSYTYRNRPKTFHCRFL